MRPFDRLLIITGCSDGAALAMHGAVTGSPWWVLGKRDSMAAG